MTRFVPCLALPVVAVAAWQVYSAISAAAGPVTVVPASQPAKAAVAAAPVAAAPKAGDWSHWRGPEENGVSRERDLPLEWTDKLDGLGENVLWKAPYGTRSTPIVQNGRVYIVNDVGSGIDEQERICCLDAKDGKLLWEKRFNVFLVDIVSSRVGWTSMAGDPETGNVYCHGTQGYITCLDKDGKLVWQRSLTEEVGRFCGYGGRLSSPVVDGDLVMTGIINANYGDQAKGANRFFGFDKRTGETVWWADFGEKVNDTYYSTPIVANIAGQRLLLSGGGDGFLNAFKVRTGEKVWNCPVSVKAINSSPVVWGDKVYIGNGEENADDPSIQGQVVCVDGADVTDHHPKLVWKADAVRAAFGSPTIYDGKLYMPEESGKLFCFDANTGAKLWKRPFPFGRAARGSPVWADGHLYITEINAKFMVIKPEATKGVKVSETEFQSANPTAVLEVAGSPAIVDGKIYVGSAENLYCIGKPSHTAAASPIPAPPAESPAAPDAKIAKLLVFPLDTTLRPGGSATLKLRAYDNLGHFLREVPASSATWTLPAPPPPPGAKVGGPPIKGTVDANGKVTVDGSLTNQMGPVVAAVDGVEARGRLRVVPPLPFSEDFSKVPVGKVPAGWVNCQGKFMVEKLPDGKNALRKATSNPNPLLSRGNCFMDVPTTSDYTIEADLMGGKFNANMPDMGILNQRYNLVLTGNSQELRLLSWDALPRVDKTIPYKWHPDAWYHMKLTSSVADGKATVRGKVWERGQAEPNGWTVEAVDPHPNVEGSPGLYGYAVGAVVDELAPIWYRNVSVVPNKQ